MNPYDSISALHIGLLLIGIGCLFLFFYIPFVTKKWKANISIFAQKASFALVIGGLILTFLHFLYFMELIPW